MAEEGRAEWGPAEPRPRRLVVEDPHRIRVEYDRNTDTLYVYFADPEEEADEAFMTEEDVIVRVKGNRLLAITVTGFSEKTGYQC